MASTYSTLKIELIGTGEQAGLWGTTTNTNLGTAIEEAIVGSADVSFSSADVTLTLTDVNTTQAARHVRLNLTGTSGGARNLILGSGCQIDKPYLINNGLADTVTVKNTTGTGIAVPAGKTMWVYNNGTNVVDAVTHLTSLTLGSALPIASGGTGGTSQSTARTGLGATTLGANIFTITNPSAITFPRFNADNTVSSLSAADFRTAIGAGVGGGTVTSVGGTGTVNGITLTGTVTSSGNLTLGGTLSNVSLSTQVTGTLPIANGGTGTTSTTFVNLATNVTGDLPFSNLAQGSALSVLGVTGNATADVASIAAGTDHQVLRRSGTTVAFGAINLAQSAAITGTLPVGNGGTGITSFGTGVATWLGTPSSANLAAAVTDETGSGSLVFSASPTFTGTVTTAAISMADNLLTRSVLKDYAVEGSAVGNTGSTETFDLTNANFFSATLDQACTFTFSNPPASGDFGTFVLELTNGGAFAITWPASVDWPGGSAPTLTASGKDQLVFTTRDGGTIWFGFVAGLDIK
jgi:hypothetical protein